jgi:hypothetical protein
MQPCSRTTTPSRRDSTLGPRLKGPAILASFVFSSAGILAAILIFAIVRQTAGETPALPTTLGDGALLR